MRCYICDKSLDTPIYNEDHQDYDPCPTCMVIINDLVEGDKDKTVADEDELTLSDDSGFQGWLIDQQAEEEEGYLFDE